MRLFASPKNRIMRGPGVFAKLQSHYAFEICCELDTIFVNYTVYKALKYCSRYFVDMKGYFWRSFLVFLGIFTINFTLENSINPSRKAH